MININGTDIYAPPRFGKFWVKTSESRVLLNYHDINSYTVLGEMWRGTGDLYKVVYNKLFLAHHQTGKNYIVSTSLNSYIMLCNGFDEAQRFLEELPEARQVEWAHLATRRSRSVSRPTLGPPTRPHSPEPAPAPAQDSDVVSSSNWNIL